MHPDDTALLTVVIPTFNRSESLKVAIKSVTDQKVLGVIIHIFDNCSTDGTEAVVRNLMAIHSNIAYTRRDSNLGALGNYSDAIHSVATPYFISLADDDWLLEDSLSLLLDAMESDSTLGAVVSQTQWIDAVGNCSNVNPGERWEFKRYEPFQLIPLWVDIGHFEWSSILFRKDAVMSFGGPDIKTDLVWDVDFQIQLFSRHPARLIKHISAVYKLHPAQGSRIFSKTKLNGILVMIEKAKLLAAKQPAQPWLEESVKQFVTKWVAIAEKEAAFYHTFIDHYHFARRLAPFLSLDVFINFLINSVIDRLRRTKRAIF